MSAGPLLTHLHRNLLRLLRFHRTGLYALALLVGVAAGLGAIAFRAGIDAWTLALTGTEDYSRYLGPSAGILSWAGRWFVLLAPVVSGLVVGPLMAWLGPTPTGHGVSGAIWSARRSDGAMRPLPAVACVASATLTIGGGGSVGPEGPIAELGASTASVFGRRLGLARGSVRMLAAAGTAAGIATAFSAPLAGAFFAMEVILLDFTLDAFALVVLACVASTVLAHHVLGQPLTMSLPPLDLAGDTDLVWVAVLGTAGGVVGVGLSRCRYLLADGASALLGRLHVPAWARPALGGLAVGAFLLLAPQTYGESSTILAHALDGRYAVGTLLVLVVAKTLATSLTLAVGFTGGVFAPSLMIGGALGAAFGLLVDPGRATSAAVFGVVGMGAVFTGAARAPITAVVLIIEMTGQYSLLLPLMLASVLATFISRFLTRTTIYTEELRRRGEDVEDPLSATLIGRRSARDLMSDPPAVLGAQDSLERAAALMRENKASLLPVVREPQSSSAAGQPSPEAPDSTGSVQTPLLLGCLDAVDLAQAALRAADGSAVTRVGDLSLREARVEDHAGATAVLELLTRLQVEGLPVVSGREGQDVLVGWISRREMVRRLFEHQQAALRASRARTSLGARVRHRWEHRPRQGRRPMRSALRRR